MTSSLRPVSRHVWESKYRFHVGERTYDRTPADSWRRVAEAAASVEPHDRANWSERFYGILADFRFLPGGRILAGAGTGRQVTLLNCLVMGVVGDSLESIFEHLKEAALTMQAGGGVGYDFSARLAVRLLDNVIDLSRYPLAQQATMARGSRRIGLGITGLADALIMLGHRYDARRPVRRQLRRCARSGHTAYRTSIELAAEKGCFPFFQRDPYLAGRFVKRLSADIRDGIARHGIRNSHLLTIASAGSISLLADNVSSGLEPVYAFERRRRVLNQDGVPEAFVAEDYSWRLWHEKRGRSARLPASFVTALEISPLDHLAMQATLQAQVDNAVSKTINVPENIPFERFQDLYVAAYERGLKGCTTFRPNPITGVVLSDVAAGTDFPHCCVIEREAD